MADEDDGLRKEDETDREMEKSASRIEQTSEAAGVSTPDTKAAQQFIEKATETAVKREIRVPEWIMAIFTIVIAVSSIAQWNEMHSGGVDTASLADAASLQAIADVRTAKNARDQAAYTKRLGDISDQQLGALTSTSNAALTSANAAMLQANSSMKQATILQDTLIAQTRPDMFVAIKGADNVENLVYTGRPADIDISFSNQGNGTAIIVSAYCGIKWNPMFTAFNPKGREVSDAEMREAHGTIIAAHSTHAPIRCDAEWADARPPPVPKWSREQYPPDAGADLMRPLAHLYNDVWIFGQVQYRDRAGNTYTTNFCEQAYRAGPDASAEDQSGFCKIHT